MAGSLRLSGNQFHITGPATKKPADCLAMQCVLDLYVGCVFETKVHSVNLTVYQCSIVANCYALYLIR